jgi:hypothetical protein
MFLNDVQKKNEVWWHGSFEDQMDVLPLPKIDHYALDAHPVP